MARVKRGKIKTKKRRKLLKLAKGYRFGGKSKERAAKERLLHAYMHSYQGRKQKKRDYRSLWQTQLNAALREKGLKYSQFMHQLKTKNIKLNRKVLADLAGNYPEVFNKIVEQVR